IILQNSTWSVYSYVHPPPPLSTCLIVLICILGSYPLYPGATLVPGHDSLFDFAQSIPSNSAMQPALNDITESQAVNDDYRNSGQTRGHLNPSMHHSSESQISTFTYTNMAPQESNFNSGTWNQYETFLRDQILPSCSQAYILTGIILSGSNPGEGRWLRDRVNVPTFYWSAFCCVKSDGTRWAEGRLGRNTSPYDVVTKTIPHLQDILSQEYKAQVDWILPREIRPA
uniref:Endonuclease domain-containing 1 protein n=1 Tax=Leptobrachium leishanense TaxID=445787 RepID=A0A8C5QKA2_9ANUR